MGHLGDMGHMAGVGLALWALVFSVGSRFDVLPARAAFAEPPCPGLWLDTDFVPGLLNSTGGFTLPANVYALEVDPNSGELVAGGFFTEAFGAALWRIGRWDGSAWTGYGEGLSAQVNALAFFAPAAGESPGEAQLVAGGSFTASGAAPRSRIARWSGEAWLPLGAGVNGAVHALCVFDDGSGPALFVAGSFTEAGGVAANRVARWDGESWSALGSTPGGGMDKVVRALAVFDDGSGPRLFAGGDFVTVDGQPASRVAAWDGAAWSAVGGGVQANVNALEVFQPWSGARLYAGGASTAACCSGDGALAAWDGTAWTVPPGTFNDPILALRSTTFDGAPLLLIGGSFTEISAASSVYGRQCIVGYDGASKWKFIGSAESAVRAIASIPSPEDADPELYIGGLFVRTNGGLAEGIARWNGLQWRRVAPPHSGPATAFWADDIVYDAAPTTIDGEPALILGGAFRSAGGGEASAVAIWRNGVLEPLGTGLTGFAYGVLASTIEPGVVYAAGTFEDGDGLNSTSNGLMRWDGREWSVLAKVKGFYPYVYGYTLAEFDDGTGPALYLGGSFTMVDGMPMSALARFDGESWGPVGAPLSNNPQVWALHTYDDGGGLRLYAGVSGSSTGVLLAWDGAAWSTIPSTLGMAVPWALEAHDDGSGEKLYFAGDIDSLLCWDGQSVQSLGVVGSSRRKMRSIDLGSGPMLMIAGFQGAIKPALSVWNGSAVVPFPGVISYGNTTNYEGEAWALAQLPGGRFMVGGKFRWMNEVAGPRPMANLAIFDSSAAPWIVDQPDDVVAAAGEAVAFSVALFGAFPGEQGVPESAPTFQWRRDGLEIADDSRTTGAKTSTLLLAEVTALDSGVYDVVVSNDCGESKSVAASLLITCLGDADISGAIDAADLGLLLNAWGSDDAMLDLDGDGEVDVDDLALLLGAWGACG